MLLQNLSSNVVQHAEQKKGIMYRYKTCYSVSAFMETKKYWWKSAKIYELYIDKFAGDIEGLISHLDYFTMLGINTLHLLPHYPSPMIDEGYDVSDYRSVRKELGTSEDFQTLLNEAHKRNIRVIVDFVLNHTSELHPWFVEARSSKKNSKRDFYLWRESNDGFEDTANMFPDFKSSNWIANPETGDNYFATFYPQQPDLNWDNEEVFDAILSYMEFWAEKGVDGFRLDAAPHLIKRENTTSYGLPETHATLKRIRARLERKYSEVVLLGETNQRLSTTREYFGDGDECHLCYHFPLMKEMWLSLMNGDRTRLDDMIKDSADIPENCQWATFLRNHDEITLRFLEPTEQAALLHWLDPEQAYTMKKLTTTSIRVAEVFKGNKQKILEAMQMLYQAPGAPVMYYGDEISMRNLPSNKEVVDTRKFVRGAFDWNEAQRQMSDPDSLFSKITSIIGGAVLPESDIQTPQI